MLLSFCIRPAPPDLSTLSLHDALPIWRDQDPCPAARLQRQPVLRGAVQDAEVPAVVPRAVLQRLELRLRSEEHTSELQSLTNLVCRLLLEKKKAAQRLLAALSSPISLG